MKSFVNAKDQHVLALVGLGGCGKTALAAEFLSTVDLPDEMLSGLFVWSFYNDVDSSAFFQSAYQFFSGGKTTDATGPAAIAQLTRVLQAVPSALIVLDGIERIQRDRSDAGGNFGKIEDGLVRQLASRVALGINGVKCLFTSRFPFPDLAPWERTSVQILDIDRMSAADALTLLERRRVTGNRAELKQIVRAFGRHALTLDFLGRYVTAYSDGTASAAMALPEPSVESDIPQERKLAKVFSAYERSLDELELAFLSGLALLRHSIKVGDLYQVLTRRGTAAAQQVADAGIEVRPSPLDGLDFNAFARTALHLTNLHLIVPETAGRLTAHPSVRDHFSGLVENPHLVHTAAYHHYERLSVRPGRKFAEDKEALDALEELIYHSAAADKIDIAKAIYSDRMGGYHHLAWRLGQYARCHRILEFFKETSGEDFIDPAGEFWSWRALGLTGGRHESISSIHILRGRISSLPQGDSLRSFLQTGKPLSPTTCDDSPVPEEAVRLLAGRPGRAIAHGIDHREARHRTQEWDIIARSEMLIAAAYALTRELPKASRVLQDIETWVLESGSQEHICLFNLVSGYIACNANEEDECDAIIREGLHVSQHCSFQLFTHAFLILAAYLSLRRRRKSQAVKYCLTALHGTDATSGKISGDPFARIQSFGIIPLVHEHCRISKAIDVAGTLLEEAVPKALVSDLFRIHEELRSVGRTDGEARQELLSRMDDTTRKMQRTRQPRR